MEGALSQIEGPVTSVMCFGQEFRNSAQLIAFLQQLPVEQRYDAQCTAAITIMDLHSWVEDQVDHFYSYVEADHAWSAYCSKEQFDTEWQLVRETAERARQGRDRVAEARSRLITIWGPEKTDAVCQGSISQTMAKTLHKVARQLPFEEMVRRLNRVMLERLQHPGRGTSKANVPQPVDFSKVLLDRQYLTVTDQEARDCGMRVGNLGLLVPSNEPRVSRIQTVPPMLPPPSQPVMAVPPRSIVSPNYQPSSPMPKSTSRAHLMVEPPTATGTHSRVASGGSLGSFPMSISPRSPRMQVPSPMGHRPRRSTASLQRMQGLIDAISDIGSSLSSPPRSLSRDVSMGFDTSIAEIEESEGGSIFEDDDRADAIAKAKQQQEKGCKCHKNVSLALKTNLAAAKPESLVRAMSLLRSFVDYHNANNPVCYKHLKNLASKLGLQTRFDYETTLERLLEVHKQRFNLGALKTDTQTYTWFRRTHRPPRPADALGIYRFLAEPEQPIVPDPKTILNSLGYSMRVLEDFNRVGSVNIDDVFSWWWTLKFMHEGKTRTIADVGYEEYDMYFHHQRLVGNKPNYGWLRTMFHALIQQVMRQDPVYWMLYVALRPDHNYRLISYPYYTKYAKPGDQTFFRHIDINVSELVRNNRGGYMIQGTVSLDDEEEGQCTQIIPGLHKHIKDWWKRVDARDLRTESFVHRITKPMFDKSDADHFKTDWTDVPCRRGTVRITLPHLPHGSHGPTKCIRRTMLPWFVGIQEDHQSLDVAESGSWSELSNAHRDLTHASMTPSGLPNRYATIPYKFPAAVSLVGLGGISDALVGRQRWDTPNVLREVRLLLGQDFVQTREYIRQWRKRAVAAVVTTFDDVVRTEKAAFRQRSYFYCAARGIDPQSLVNDDPPPEVLEAASITGDDPRDHY